MGKYIYIRLTLLVWAYIILSCAGCSKNLSEGEPPIVPKTTYVPEPINSFTPKRVADLSLIVFALEKYKMDYHSYPVSSDYKIRWDRFVSKSNEINPNWIKGLVPTYIRELPTDPRNDNYPGHQYAYKSNGAHYKLIALRADDCDLVKAKAPQMIDPKRGCMAYGYWTSYARNW